MKKILSSLFLSLSIITCCLGQEKEEKLVRESFNSYKTSILNDKGEKAVDFVDSKTISYYNEILETTKKADSLTLNSLGILDKLMVISIRYRTSKRDILSFNGKELLIYAIKEGMVGKNSVMNTEIGDVEIDKNFAKGQLISNGQKAPFYFHFYKESNNWKIDLTSIFPVGAMAFKKMIEDNGEEENQYLIQLLEMITGKKPVNEIWKPIL
ncbi:hypothetical protein P700755_003965 [Psychroflexus torquis ATCC 700755]|uniref:Uncharacterized protein n=1 Tax=Psychroflexus torquis (strain ATCC 700755 / CIP 106069 / ACAM 623) TaxID=313595 RepID=K4IJM7_PSYTT|nr:hypothetical protein [Psychroflexus torquis]AFU70534.1 hypothetical protein P700755_003965 [Psychroflexus torquis ATCC 700755]